MTGIMTPTVRLHHFRFGTEKFQALGFCCTECASGLLQKLFASILVTSPHSVTTEALSNYTRTFLNRRIHELKIVCIVEWCRRANYDPHPAVVIFL
jgi:hypothetical protein